jgi:hypothetical protein
MLSKEDNEIAGYEIHTYVPADDTHAGATTSTIDEACMTALYMERTAKIMAIARLHGYQGPTPDAIATLTESRKKLFRRPRDEMFHSADWNYYADKVKKGERWTRGWS